MGPTRLLAALLGGLLLVPAAGNAEENAGAPGAATLGGAIQLRPDAASATPSAALSGTAPARPGEGQAPLLFWPTGAAAEPAAGGSPMAAPLPAAKSPQPPAAGGAPPMTQIPLSDPAREGAAAPIPGNGMPASAAPVAATPELSGEPGPGAAGSAPAAEPGVLVLQGSDPPSPSSRPSAEGSAPAAPDPAAPDAAAATSTGNRRELVLDRRRRQLVVMENGTPLRRFPVAVGMPGWETPVGRFAVIEKQTNPTWEHPVSGLLIQPGPDNPLGSRWIGFYRDCSGRRGFNGKEHLVVQGCVVAGFHGTPNRASIGQAASHGCVRLYDEHARDLFDLVRLGTPVTVLP